MVHDDSLEQGDILRNFDLAIPSAMLPMDVDEYILNVQSDDVVILTQSCDIEHGKARSLILCPVAPLWDFIEDANSRGGKHWASSSIRENLWQGNLPGYHLLNESKIAGLELPLTVVDFHEIYSAPTVQVRQYVQTCGPRLRLCPPYREHLAQAFARFFMHVGLPVSIPKDKLKKPN